MLLIGHVPLWSPTHFSYPLLWIDISYNLLKGSLTDWVYSLTSTNTSHLISIDITSNEFTGCLPTPWEDIYIQGFRYDEMSRLATSLKSLHISSNPLSCPLLSLVNPVLSLPSLLSLDIAQTLASGHLPINYLQFLNNNGHIGISSAIYQSNGLSTLIRLSVSYNPSVTGSLPDELPALLLYLDVSSTGMYGPIPSNPSYASLSSLMATHTRLNSTHIPTSGVYAYMNTYPSFMTVSHTNTSDWGYAPPPINMWCPNPRGSIHPSMVIAMDYGYDGYLSCVCNAGYQSSINATNQTSSSSNMTSMYNTTTTTTTGTNHLSPPLCTPCGYNAYRVLSFSSSEATCQSCPTYAHTSSMISPSIDYCQCDQGRYQS